MSPIRLFIDEDSMDQRFIKALRARDVEVTTVGEAVTFSSSDIEQPILATKLQRVLYTAKKKLDDVVKNFIKKVFVLKLRQQKILAKLSLLILKLVIMKLMMI